MRNTVFTVIFFAAASCILAQAPDESMQRVSLSDGRHIEYAVHGEGEPLLLIHGTGAANALYPIFNSQALEGFQLILMHRRGYAGSSQLTGPFSISDQAQDALAVLDTLALESAHVAGHSYGSSVGLQMAVEAPQRVLSLTLIDMVPPPGLLPPPDQNTETRQQADPAATLMIDVQRQLADGSIASADAVAAVFELAMGPDWRDFFDIFDGYEQTVNDFPTAFPIEGQAMGEWQSRPLDFGAITLPILVVWGEDQWQHPPSLGQAFKNALPQTELRPIAEADHASIVQQPDIIARAIFEFVSGN